MYISRENWRARDGPQRVSRWCRASRRLPRLHVDAPEARAAILVGDLLRNAFSYTDRGEVDVSIDADKVVIRGAGVGIAPDRLAESTVLSCAGIGATRRARRRVVDGTAAV